MVLLDSNCVLALVLEKVYALLSSRLPIPMVVPARCTEMLGFLIDVVAGVFSARIAVAVVIFSLSVVVGVCQSPVLG
jgi:hypothetical protein